jgi:hypothetical protein
MVVMIARPICSIKRLSNYKIAPERPSIASIAIAWVRLFRRCHEKSVITKYYQPKCNNGNYLQWPPRYDICLINMLMKKK